MPDIKDFINLGLGGVLIVLFFRYGVPWLRSYTERVDKERRERQDQVVALLQEANEVARRELKEQSAGFLQSLSKRDEQAAKKDEQYISVLRGLNANIEAALRRLKQ